MPEISRFFGIVIKMFFDDHNPPHFHAFYGEDEVLIDIRAISAFAESSPRALGLLLNGPHCTRKNCWITGKGQKASNPRSRSSRCGEGTASPRS